MSVTQIQAGTQHNVVPDTCHFVIDVRTTEKYPNEVLFRELESMVQSRLKARSFRLNPSYIESSHPLARTITALGIEKYGSPTLSDQAIMNIPSIKLGPGKSSRSHTADEFIKISEIELGIHTYNRIIHQLKKHLAS